MKAVTLVTSNESKVREAKAVLKGWNVLHMNVDVQEIKSTSMEETIVSKAKTAYAMIRKPVLVEDTGLFLDAYHQFPGTYTKFCIRLLGMDGILRLLQGKVRTAQFQTWLAWYDGRTLRVFQGVSKGKIAEKASVKAAEKKLPYDSIFIPDGDTRPYSEMSKEEKAKTSHRAAAFANFVRGMSHQ
ncbi:non-canonical purine NTP pyrophosphatase [Candidatus Micrarchaeota archaeon]|nr:non-canonical purine NTP pyrophosphatase [Candidatus Micrarchaeota archaeon]